MQDHVHLAKQISTIYTCMWSQLKKPVTSESAIYYISIISMETHTMGNYTIPKSVNQQIYKMDFWGAPGLQES